jgi:hypothetical protein
MTRTYMLLGGALLLAVAGCKPRSPIAYGHANAIVVAAAPALWATVEETVYSALEPRIFTIREERTFELTYISPADPKFPTLRLWKQVLLIGEPDASWMEEVVGRHGGAPAELPALIEVEDIWARGQRVIALLLPPGGGVAEVHAMLPELHQHLDNRFRSWAIERMFVSGRDGGLERRLGSQAGFTLTLPNVYSWEQRDSAYVFVNDHPRASQLVRSVLVTWRTGVPETLDPGTLLAWRDSIGEHFYAVPQVTERENLDVRELPGPGAGGVELRGIWSRPVGTWPGAGPFIDRMIACPEQNRTYFIDAWLFAPGREKYEYMIHLETILNSFRCGAQGTQRAG